MDEFHYIERCVRLECSMGTMPNPINVKKDHGVIWEKEDDKFPIMNANDHNPRENVIHFGRCQSNRNPGNLQSIDSLISNPISLIKNLNLVSVGSTLIRKVIGCDGCKCEPKTLVPWINTSTMHMVEGAPALTSESKLACYYGGIITITYETKEAKSE